MPGPSLTPSLTLTRRAALAAPAVLAAGRASAQPAADPGSALGAVLFEEEQAHGFSGAVLVARRGERVLDRAFGAVRGVEMRTDTRFWIASAGKQFVSAAVLACADRGLLGLDDPLSRFFADAPSDKRVITVRQLLLHASGLGQSYAGEGRADRATAVALMLAEPLAAPPGQGFHYSNSNFQLAAAIVETVTDTGYHAFARERLWGRTGLTATGFAGDAGAALVAPGKDETPARLAHAEWGEEGVYSTTGDLWRWWRALADGRVLSQPGRTALFTPGVRISEGQGALGWFIGSSANGARTIFTRGNEDYGPNSAIYAYPDADTLAIVLTHAGDSPRELSWSRAVIAHVERVLGL